ncbi:hypothetical protein B484DRAFT_457118 [Ochromonadaceae sp. CCMP2298]|nr:hypothetical protein B484DRAFT_457118 [Ochromonadaceae sp. CCMP2298]
MWMWMWMWMWVLLQVLLQVLLLLLLWELVLWLLWVRFWDRGGGASSALGKSHAGGPVPGVFSRCAVAARACTRTPSRSPQPCRRRRLGCCVCAARAGSGSLSK